MAPAGPGPPRWRLVFLVGLVLFVPSLILEETYPTLPGALEWAPFLAFWGGLAALLLAACLGSSSRWRAVLGLGVVFVLATEIVGRSLPHLVSPSVAWTLFLSWWGGLALLFVGAIGVWLSFGASAVGTGRRSRPSLPTLAREPSPGRCRWCGAQVDPSATACGACGSVLG